MRGMPAGNDQRFNGVHWRLLPYIEQDAVYKAYDNGDYGKTATFWCDDDAWNVPGDAPSQPPQGRFGAGKPDLSIFLCPTAPSPDTAKIVFAFTAVGFADKHFRNDFLGYPNDEMANNFYMFADSYASTAVRELSKTNYLFNRGFAGNPTYEGPYVACGDGSIRAIASNMDFDTYVYLCGSKDGRVVNIDN